MHMLYRNSYSKNLPYGKTSAGHDFRLTQPHEVMYYHVEKIAAGTEAMGVRPCVTCRTGF